MNEATYSLNETPPALELQREETGYTSGRVVNVDGVEMARTPNWDINCTTPHTVRQPGLLTLNALQVLLDAVIGSLRIADRLSIWRFDAKTREAVVNQILDRMNGVKICLSPDAPLPSASGLSAEGAT